MICGRCDSVMMQELRTLMMGSAQRCKIGGMCHAMILQELRLMMLGRESARMVLQRIVACSDRPMVSVVLVERGVQLMCGRSQMLLNPVVKQVLVADGILVNHPIVNSPAKSVALMLNTIVLSPTKMLDSAEVLRVSQMLSTAKVLGAAKMLSPTHVNAMTSAEPANVPTHMATADMAATRVSPAAMTVAGLEARSCQNK